MHGVITFYLRTIAAYQAVLPLTITKLEWTSPFAWNLLFLLLSTNSVLPLLVPMVTKGSIENKGFSYHDYQAQINKKKFCNMWLDWPCFGWSIWMSLFRKQWAKLLEVYNDWGFCSNLININWGKESLCRRKSNSISTAGTNLKWFLNKFRMLQVWLKNSNWDICLWQ